MIEYKDFIEYLNIRSKMHASFGYREFIESLPESVKEVLKTDKFLRPKHLTFEACRTLLLDMAGKIEPKYEIDNNNTNVIDTITSYLIFDSSFSEISSDYRLSKGLMIMGSLGTGKTILLKSITNLLYYFNDIDYNYKPGFSIIPTHRISANFIKHGYEYFDSPNLTGENVLSENIGIDDLGSENKINYYGTQINVVGELILRRYEKYQSQRKGRILCTTNLNGDQLKEFYGERVHDRLVELVNPIVLTGNSRRK